MSRRPTDPGERMTGLTRDDSSGPFNPIRHSQTAMHRLVVVTLAAVSLAFAWICMAAISRTDPWYRNTDMNMHNLVDALSINSNVRPNPFAQPAVPLKYLLALDYRVRHELGLLPVWNLERFGASPHPLQEIPALIQAGRVHSRILVIGFILAAGALTFAVTRKIESACLTLILLSGSAGLLFHGLLTRPELLCVGFGNILALLCTWRGLGSRSWLRHHAWLFLAGIFVGLSALEKLPGVCYLALCYGWCWLSVLTAPRAAEADRVQPPFWGGLLPAAGGASALWLLFHLGAYQDTLGPVVISRLRAAAVIVAVLPLLVLWPGRNRFVLFLLDRVRELTLLGGGLLAALTISQLLLHGVMDGTNATDYFAGVLHFLVDPVPYMDSFLVDNPNVSRVFVIYLQQNSILFAGALAVIVAACLMRSIPLRLKAFMILLLAGALGMTLVMSKRHFLAQYSIFPQVPLLLIWSLGLSGIEGWWQERPRAESHHWAIPLIVTAAFVLMLTVYFRLQPVYDTYQSDAGLPVNGLTLTFIYDHDAHTTGYLQIMKTHYGDREQFAAILERYLADPANRY